MKTPPGAASLSRNPKDTTSCGELAVEPCSEMRTTPARVLLLFKLISKSFQFLISIQRDHARDSRTGTWEGMSCLGQEVAGLLLAAAFSICQNTACGGLWETPEEMEGPARVKRGSPTAPRFSQSGHTLIWPLKKAVQLFARKITIQKGKKWQVLELTQEKLEKCLDCRMRERKPSRKQQAVRWTQVSWNFTLQDLG